MNLETEKRFLILLSITELEGSATKRAVLDNIENQDYCDFTDNDLKNRNFRSELVWRNDFAFIREHLKNDGYINASEKNRWKITESGTTYLTQITKEIINSDPRELKKISCEALVAAYDLLNKQLSENSSTDKFISDSNIEQDFGGTVYTQILARRGQKKFRNSLLKRYGEICLITECKIIDLIEAAHIVPFRIEKSHNLDNGLLLRSDIHTLFDLNLIGIDKNFTVHLNPRIMAEYSAINNKQIFFNSTEKPNLDKIEFKWNEFVKHSYLK